MNSFGIATLLLGLASQVIQAAIKLKQTAGQTHEWTPEEESEFDEKLEKARTGELEHWRIDPDPS